MLIAISVVGWLIHKGVLIVTTVVFCQICRTVLILINIRVCSCIIKARTKKTIRVNVF